MEGDHMPTFWEAFFGISDFLLMVAGGVSPILLVCGFVIALTEYRKIVRWLRDRLS